MIQVNIMSYRYGHLLAHCVESILSQTKKVDSIVIVDDGVGDCEYIVKKYIDSFDDSIVSIRFIKRIKNLGIVDNFQDILFNETYTDKVMFIGADNFLRPDAIELMDRENADIVSSDIILFGTEVSTFKVGLPVVKHDGYDIWRFKSGKIEQGNYIHGSSLYNVDMAKKSGGYEKNPLNKGKKNTEEDYMLWKKMITNKATHKHVNQPLLYYRRHKNNYL